jgi:hypothetical protein
MGKGKIVFMYLRAILCPFQISVDFFYVPVGRTFLGPKKYRFLGPPPLKCPLLLIVPPQNHFVLPHINNKYINSYSVRAGLGENVIYPQWSGQSGGSIYCTSSALSNTGRSYPHHW